MSASSWGRLNERDSMVFLHKKGKHQSPREMIFPWWVRSDCRMAVGVKDWIEARRLSLCTIRRGFKGRHKPGGGVSTSTLPERRRRFNLAAAAMKKAPRKGPGIS